MRIAIVQRSLAIVGGAENIVVWLAWGLRERGHEVAVFTQAYEPSLWPSRFTTGLDVRLLQESMRFIRSKRLLIRGVARQLRQQLEGFDLVNCHGWPSHLWVARARRMGLDVPRVVWYCQEPNRKIHWEWTERNLLRYLRECHDARADDPLRQALGSKATGIWRAWRRRRNARWDRASAAAMDAVLVNSRFSAESVERVYGRAGEVCYLGIPLDGGPRPADSPESYVCVVSPLRRKKNLHNVLGAMALAVARGGLGGLRLKIAGSGPDRDALERSAGDLGIADRVDFLGYVPHEELPALYGGARLTVYVPIDEPFGLVPVESMAQGTPVLVSDHGGTVESVVHGQTGLHVDPFDADAIARGIETLCRDDGARAAMGDRARRHVRERFSLESFLDRFEAMAFPR